MSAAALKAKRWRENKKLADASFAKQEAERKRLERGVGKQKDEIEAILATNRDGAPPTLTVDSGDTAPRGSTKIHLVGGGAEIDKKIAGSSGQRRIKPKKSPDDSKYEEPVAGDEKRIWKKYSSKDGKNLRTFVYSLLTPREHSLKATEWMCLLCQVVITPKSIKGTFFKGDTTETESAMVPHVEQHHPEVFQSFLDKLKAPAKKVCLEEDHAKRIEIGRGRGNGDIRCGVCKKIIWRTPKPVKIKPVKSLVKRRRGSQTLLGSDIVPTWVTEDKSLPESNI